MEKQTNVTDVTDIHPIRIEVHGIDPERLYTAREACQLLDRHPQWPYHALRRGVLQSVDLGASRARLFKGAELVRYVKSQLQ